MVKSVIAFFVIIIILRLPFIRRNRHVDPHTNMLFWSLVALAFMALWSALEKMPIYYEFVANRIQYITLPIELIGFTLATIEIFNPKLADDIEAALDKLSKGRILQLALLRNLKQKPDKPTMIAHNMIFIWSFGVPFLLFILFILEVPIGVSFRTDIQNFAKESELMDNLLLIIFFACWVALSGIFLALGTKVIPPLFRRLDSISKGRALGSFGMILATLGVLGEVYQFMTMISSS